MRALVNGKPIKFMGTSAWHEQYGGLEAQLYIHEALDCLKRHPVDMLVFEQPVIGRMQIRSAGYDLATDSKLDETTVLFSTDSLPIKKFWLKIDHDEDGNYIGTFLFPEEY